MTRRLNRHIHGRTWLRAEPRAVAAFSVALAYGGGLWLQVLHEAQGATERNEPPLVLHWLRDSTLALPLVLISVWIALSLARRLARGDRASILTSVLDAALVALVASALIGAATPIHGLLFQAHEHGHHDQDLPLLAHVTLDALQGLAANLPLAGLVALLLRVQIRVSPVPRLSTSARNSALVHPGVSHEHDGRDA